MSRKRIIIITILVIVAVGAITVYKIWNKPFKDPLEGDAIKVTAIQLFNDFSTNEISAQKKYVPETLGSKVIEVSGEIKDTGRNESGETYYYLKTGSDLGGVKCVMDHEGEIKNAVPGIPVVLRGFCDGVKRDTMMEIVLMDVIVRHCKTIK